VASGSWNNAFIQSAISAGIDTVINLGVGLDTRPYRVGLDLADRDSRRELFG